MRHELTVGSVQKQFGNHKLIGGTLVGRPVAQVWFFQLVNLHCHPILMIETIELVSVDLIIVEFAGTRTRLSHSVGELDIGHFFKLLFIEILEMQFFKPLDILSHHIGDQVIVWLFRFQHAYILLRSFSRFKKKIKEIFHTLRQSFPSTTGSLWLYPAEEWHDLRNLAH